MNVVDMLRQYMQPRRYALGGFVDPTIMNIPALQLQGAQTADPNAFLAGNNLTGSVLPASILAGLLGVTPSNLQAQASPDLFNMATTGAGGLDRTGPLPPPLPPPQPAPGQAPTEFKQPPALAVPPPPTQNRIIDDDRLGGPAPNFQPQPVAPTPPPPTQNKIITDDRLGGQTPAPPSPSPLDQLARQAGVSYSADQLPDSLKQSNAGFQQQVQDLASARDADYYRQYFDALKQFGGNPTQADVTAAAGKGVSFAHGGLVAGAEPGRADSMRAKVSRGSYIIPAAVVSALGEGNTDAGAKRLDEFVRKRRSAPGLSVMRRGHGYTDT